MIENFNKNGNYIIQLVLPNIMELPGTYRLTPYDILDIRNVVGVDNVIEKERG